jgi:hypothetical protein
MRTDTGDHLAGVFQIAPARDEIPPPELPPDEGPTGGRVYDGPKVPAVTYTLLTIDDLDQLPPPEYLIAPLLTKRGLANLFGQSGTYKSFVALDWALCVAAGRQWFDHATDEGPTVYVASEGAPGLRKRIGAWLDANPGHDPRRNFRAIAQAVNLLDPASITAAHQALHDQLDTAPELVVVDTLARAMPGGDENSAKDMGLVVDAVDRIRRDFDTAVLLVHHSGLEQGRERGSTSLPGALDTRIEAAGGAGYLTLRCRKQKDDAEFPPIQLATRTVADSLVLDLIAPRDPGHTTVINAVRAFPGPVARETLAKHIGGRIAEARDAIDAATADPACPVQETPGKHGARLYTLHQSPAPQEHLL